MNLTVSDEIYLENPDMKFFSPQKKNFQVEIHFQVIEQIIFAFIKTIISNLKKD